MSRTYQSQVDECVQFIAPRLNAAPEWGIVLGTGQGDWAARLTGGGVLAYEELPHFPPATSPSHAGRLCWGEMAGKHVMLCQGRFHAYEGYTLRQVTFPVRVMASLGIKTLVVTNAAGGLNPLFKAGDLMLISDHINLIGDNPLVGDNIDAWGTRFPDLSQVYDRDLRETTEKVARRLGLGLRQGIYVAVKGPSLETPAETRFLRMIGADAVGMSTIPEVIVAVHCGMRILGFSAISNVNLPDCMKPASLKEILANAALSGKKMIRIVEGVCRKI